VCPYADSLALQGDNGHVKVYACEGDGHGLQKSITPLEMKKWVMAVLDNTNE
jgi:hypothetical protein